VKLPTRAMATVSFTRSIGASLAVGARVRRGDNALYRVFTVEEYDDTTLLCEISALDAGTFSNLVNGESLALVSSAVGVVSPGTVSNAQPARDREPPDELLSRLLIHLESQGAGGSPGDYADWAREVPGVSRAWEFPLYLGPGTVAIFIADDSQGNVTAPIPSGALVDDTQDHIDEERPVTAKATVFAPVADPVDFDIELTPNTTEIRAAVEAEMRRIIYVNALPGGTTQRSRLLDGFAFVRDLEIGLTDWALNTPAANIVHAAGHIAVAGDFTFSAGP